MTLTPSALGADSGTLSVTDSASNSPQTTTLTGTGVLPVTLTNAPLSFGNVGENSPSSSKNIELRNYQAVALTISGITLSNPDYTKTDNCKGKVAAGGRCTIAILFTPSASGTRAALLTMTDNARGSPQSVALSGTETHDVILSWAPSASPGIVGYNVYRGTTSGGESATPLISIPVVITTYIDDNVTAGAAFYYVVWALASNNVLLCANSTEVSATVPSP